MPNIKCNNCGATKEYQGSVVPVFCSKCGKKYAENSVDTDNAANQNSNVAGSQHIKNDVVQIKTENTSKNDEKQIQPRSLKARRGILPIVVIVLTAILVVGTIAAIGAVKSNKSGSDESAENYIGTTNAGGAEGELTEKNDGFIGKLFGDDSEKTTAKNSEGLNNPLNDVTQSLREPVAKTTAIVTGSNGHVPVVTQRPTQSPVKPTDSPNKPTQPAKTTLTAQEALDLFNKATVGKSKNGTRYTNVVIVEIPGSLSGIMSTLEEMIASATQPVVLGKFPNSKLTMADCSSVSGTKSGNNWVITLKIKNTQAANTKAFAELPEREIDLWIERLKITPAGGIKLKYCDGTIVATVTPDGKLVSGTYTMNVDVTADNVKALGMLSVNHAYVKVTQTDKF